MSIDPRWPNSTSEILYQYVLISKGCYDWKRCDKHCLWFLCSSGKCGYVLTYLNVTLEIYKALRSSLQAKNKRLLTAKLNILERPGLASYCVKKVLNLKEINLNDWVLFCLYLRWI